ncbi:MAG: cache domain-containing protein, partial [Chloroflexota bacterium]|nr:cache domain-containing protein [Chloroflexota bacterium]
MRIGQLSLQLKLLLVIALATGGLLAVLILVAVTALTENTRRSLQEQLSVAQSMASQMDQLLAFSLKTVEVNGQRPSAEGETTPQAMRRSLQRVRQELPVYPWYIAFLDAEGKVVDSSPFLPELVGQDRSSLKEVGQALKQGVSSLSGLYPDVQGERAFYFVAPVYGSEGKVTGSLLAAVAPQRSNLMEFLPRLSLGATGYVDVVDSQGIILTSSRSERVYQHSDHGERLADLIRTKGSTVGGCHRCHTPFGEGREREVLAFASFPRFPWGIAIRQDEGEVFAPVRRLERTLALLGALGLGIALTATWIGGRRVIEPLRRLTSASTGLARGDLETPVPVVGESEVRLLSEALERMRRELQASLA